ncbi:tyrosine-type recombinase/integrase [Salipaludibacillus sp. LMS25]|jgi:integrase|uniref:tyrosine-type recombinase/integrase n=1 Tax=Salipaludibacillus sp. LMS25 TaxID=2924031 RepID=UPI0020D0C376|nr:tyrosine-type recombinase/integrase [Salipaludibacillus sp. LMS25]UTR13217.1 tyrosine-type recombinase/integrase [Salipaludibacillus sp. LMS25]
MEYVHPIKDVRKIRLMKKLLKLRSTRDHLLFVLGINTGLRISDMLPLTFGDMLNEKEKLTAFITIRGNTIFLNANVKEALKLHLAHTAYTREDYLFRSKKGSAPITRQQAYRMIHEVARQAGIKENIGTHTLRKTFGYHAYRKGVAISLIQQRFHQSTPAETRKYIDVDRFDPIELDVNL